MAVEREDYMQWEYIVLLIVIWVVMRIMLGIIDRKTNYSNRDFYGRIESKEKIRYIVPYYTWQRNKLQAIIEKYKDYVDYNGKKYKVVIWHQDKPHMSILTGHASFLKNDFIAELAPFDEYKTATNSVSLDVSGNGNVFNISQSNSNSIAYEIDSLITENSVLSDDEKDALLLFKYKLSDNTASSTNAKRIIEILTPYVPLTTSLINLIRSLFS